MAAIRPIPAIRYNTASGSDLSNLIAPPYDVLDIADKQALLARDARNFVAVDLPQCPAKTAGPAEVYAAARKTLDRWLETRVMVRDASPAIYVYHQAYRHAGVDYLRKMFFARLRLEPFGKGSVFPHERTFGGPKEDRLLLTQATQANLSPIFGLYEDGANAVAARLQKAIGGEPLMHGQMDGVTNRVWAVTDDAAVRDVTELMALRAIFIADGHHRYGTGLMYRDWLASERGALPADHPANFVLCVFCAMEDPGLQILATHRVLPRVKGVAALLASDAALEVRDLNAADADGALKTLATLGPQAVGLYESSTRKYVGVRPRDARLLDKLEPDHSPAWRGLALAVLHAYLLDRCVAPKLTGGNPPEIHYVKSATDAVKEADREGGCVFLMAPTTMEELRGVCKANDLMPQKSTFFYPKLASGLIVNPLA
ncbi:hypothetical protein RAS1_28410 [Phycisphaerae bacterium RAS1]|nr:hypothetical protein RAS1_28410 [Phycisphaerae bacterium RAS1]